MFINQLIGYGICVTYKSAPTNPVPPSDIVNAKAAFAPVIVINCCIIIISVPAAPTVSRLSVFPLNNDNAIQFVNVGVTELSAAGELISKTY